MFRKLSIFFIAALFAGSIFMGLDRFFHRNSHQLATFKVTAFHPYSSEWETSPLSLEEQKTIDKILSQKFTYFDKGSQAYVFLSEDKKYVLKFVKQHIFAPTSWLSYIPLPFNPYYKSYLVRQKKLQETFYACKTAYTEFKNETALVYLHLNPTRHLNRKVTLFDKRGKALKVDIDETCFIIQKRANLIYSRITELMSQQDVAGAQGIISSTFELIAFLGTKGVVDNDPVIRRNFGLIDDKAVQIDIGNMAIDPQRVNTPRYKEEIGTITRPFRSWLEKNYPELLPHFDENLQQVLAH